MAQKTTLTPKVGWAMAAELTRKFADKKMNIMFTGMPGIGKTALMDLIGSQLKYTVVKFHPVISDPTDFKGMPWVFMHEGKERAVFVPFNQLKALIDAKGPVLCVIDDFGQAAGAVQAACMQLLHGGELCGKKISKHVRFVACTNRKQDRAGVTGMLEPVKSRFHGIFELVPELDPWIDYMTTVGISPMLVAFMRNRPNWLTGGDAGWSPSADIVNQACPRTIHHLSDIINLAFDPISRPTAYAGAVGPEMADEYYSFEQLVTKMPDLDRICKDPLNAEMPSTPDIGYAMLGALHSRMNRGNLKNIYVYMGRAFTKELQAVFHFDLPKFNENLTKHEAYIRWAAENGDLFTN
jgi:hypothetical protein